MWTKARSTFFSLSLLTVVLIAPARADDIPPCAVPSGVSTTMSLSAAPPALVRALIRHVGEVVEPGTPFDATDVVVTGHHRRLIFIWHYNVRWIVATEHGGIGYNDPIFAFDLWSAAGDARLVTEREAIPSTVCDTASGLLHVEAGQR